MLLQVTTVACFFQSLSEDLFFTAFGERERERETPMKKGNIDWLPSYMHPNRRSNLQPRYVPWPGVEPMTFRCVGQRSNQLSHASQGNSLFLFMAKLYSIIGLCSNLSFFLLIGIWIVSSLRLQTFMFKSFGRYMFDCFWINTKVCNFWAVRLMYA